MKIYVVVSNNRNFSNTELDTTIKSFDTKEKAREQLKSWYDEDMNNLGDVFDSDCSEDNYWIQYTDSDGEHEINTEIHESEVK